MVLRVLRTPFKLNASYRTAKLSTFIPPLIQHNMADHRKADVLIIGGGPTGLSAALFLVRTRRSVLIYDNQVYRNAKASEMHSVAGGYDGVPPQEFLKATRKDLDKYAAEGLVNIVTAEVTHAESVVPPGSPEVGLLGTYFKGQDSEGNEWSARKLLLATGIEDVMPSIPGFAELWGNQIFHCIYCHGYEQRDKPLGILLPVDFPIPGINTMVIKLILAKFTKLYNDITIFTNGLPVTTADDLKTLGIESQYLELFKSQAIADPTGNTVRRIVTGRISSIAPNGEAGLIVNLSSDDQGLGPVKLFSLQHLPPGRPSSKTQNLLKQLGLDTDVNTFGELATVGAPGTGKTKVEGVYAAGNLITFKSSIPHSVASGMEAAVAIGDDLGGEEIQAGLAHLQQLTA